MKRDMGLIRRMLLTIEEHQDPLDDSRMAQSFIYTLEGANHSESEIDYNLVLLFEAGLVKGNLERVMSGNVYAFIEGLTWEGHDFLDAIRQDAVWQGVQEKAQKAGLNVTNLAIDVVKNLAVSVAKELLNLKE